MTSLPEVSLVDFSQKLNCSIKPMNYVTEKIKLNYSGSKTQNFLNTAF